MTKRTSHPILDVSLDDAQMIERIVERLNQHLNALGGTKPNLAMVAMDIRACHANGCPLRLVELYAGPTQHFLHDVLGIHHYIDRSTGQLTECFVPRYASMPPGIVAKRNRPFLSI